MSTFSHRFRPRPRPDPRAAKVSEALVVLATVAAQDSDYAKRQNGVGFSRPDSTKGHALAQVSLSAALQNEQLMADVLAMAARYRRQASRIAQGELF